MKNPLKVLEPNLLGSDYVIGDLHGSFSAFKNLIQNLNFNSESDRIISVGDLVDRGPDSLSCLSLIREPWFHSVFANHEQLMVAKFKGELRGQYWYPNGGHWGMEAYNDYKAVYIDHDSNRIPSDHSMEVIDLLPLVEELPYLITVNTKSGKKFHVLHAELPSGTLVTDEVLTDPEKVYRLATIQRGDGDAFLWSRNIYHDFYSRNLSNKEMNIQRVSGPSLSMFNKNLSHIISGHTIVQKPLTIIAQTNIDTGAYGSYWKPVEPYATGGQSPQPWAGLTCVELESWKFYKATESNFSEVEPVVITEEDLNGRLFPRV